MSGQKLNEEYKPAVPRPGTQIIRTFDVEVLGITSYKDRVFVCAVDGVYEFNEKTETFDKIPFRLELPRPYIVDTDGSIKPVDDPVPVGFDMDWGSEDNGSKRS